MILRAFEGNCLYCGKRLLARVLETMINGLVNVEWRGDRRKTSFQPSSPATRMTRFFVGQRWICRDPLFGTFHGEIIDASQRGRYGVVVITDEQGNLLDTFNGRATDFQASGEWQVAD